MKKHITPAALATALIAVLPGGAQALEGPKTYRSSYTVSLLGFKIGVSDVTTTIDGDTYRLEASLRSAGLARLFGAVAGSTAVSGTFTEQGPQPQDFAMSYVNGGKRTASRMTFAKGDVVTYEVTPKPRAADPGYVALSRDHLLAVADPFTSLMIRAKDPESVCDRTVKAFDGELRADFKLSDPEISNVSVAGYKGIAVTCTAKFVPVAGYYKGASAIEFLRRKAGISITFAPIDSIGIYAPVSAAIQSTIGWVTVKTTRFTVQE